MIRWEWRGHIRGQVGVTYSQSRTHDTPARGWLQTPGQGLWLLRNASVFSFFLHLTHINSQTWFQLQLSASSSHRQRRACLAGWRLRLLFFSVINSSHLGKSNSKAAVQSNRHLTVQSQPQTERGLPELLPLALLQATWAQSGPGCASGYFSTTKCFWATEPKELVSCGFPSYTCTSKLLQLPGTMRLSRPSLPLRNPRDVKDLLKVTRQDMQTRSLETILPLSDLVYWFLFFFFF